MTKQMRDRVPMASCNVKQDSCATGLNLTYVQVWRIRTSDWRVVAVSASALRLRMLPESG
jgi:hypothetical protein